MDRHASAIVALALLAALVAAPGRAEDERTKPDTSLQYDVVVTATRVETPEREVASSVTVITAAELARTHRTTVLDALGDVLGLSSVQSGGPGAAASVFIRGAGSEHTLVLLDGIPLNDPINPSRSYDFAHLSLADVERIEILRGPQSPLYGSDALGGVINIITKRGRGRPRFSLSLSGGSYGTAGADAGVSGSSGRFDYALGLSAFSTAGVSAADSRLPGNAEKDGTRNLSFSGKAGYALRPNLDLEVTLRAVTDRTALDDFGGPYGDDPNDVQDYRSALARVLLRGLFLDQSWEQKLSFSWVGSDRTLENPVDPGHPFSSESGDYASGLVRADWQNNFFLGPSQTLTAGLEIGRESGRSDDVSTSQYGTYESSFPRERADAAGFYVQDQWKVADAFFLAAGGRLDLHSRTGAVLTYRIAPAYILNGTGTKLRATLGTAFKSPSLYQLFAPPTSFGPIGNINLRPERSIGWDAGVDQNLFGNRLQVGLTYFSNSFRDLIEFNYGLGYVNIERARTSGIETSLGSRPFGSQVPLSFRFSYTHLTARDETTGAALLRRPRNKLSAEVESQPWKGIDLTASVLFVGKRPDQEFAAYPYETVELSRYVLLNAVLSAPVSRSLEVFVRADNILNTRYEMVWGYGTYGFTLMAGFRLGR